MNKVQILGIIILLMGIIFHFFIKIEIGLIPGILIGLGAGLTVYKKNN